MNKPSLVGLRDRIKSNSAFSRSGQTLIETLAAVFILVMGITAAAGLALYAFSTSANVIKQIIAIGLAREGLEAVKNMRDTNWLKDSLSNDCYNFTSTPIGQSTASCYKDWLKSEYDLRPQGGGSYRLSFDPADAKFWDLKNSANKFGLNFNPDPSSISFQGFYSPEISAFHGNSDYYREIGLFLENNPPYNRSEYNRLRVVSRVWWTDKKCPRVTAFSQAHPACKIELQTYLTNWKNY